MTSRRNSSGYFAGRPISGLLPLDYAPDQVSNKVGQLQASRRASWYGQLAANVGGRSSESAPVEFTALASAAEHVRKPA